MSELSSNKNVIGQHTIPAEYALCTSLSWLCSLRWLAGGGIILAVWLAQWMLGVDLPVWPITSIGVMVLTYNIVFRQWLERLTCSSSGTNPAAHTLARLQIGADWLMMTVLIHFSGGVESPVIFYFFFHIILATILLSVRDAYFLAIVSIGLLGFIALFEYRGWLLHWGIHGFSPIDLYNNDLYVSGVLFFFASATLISVYLATQITRNLRARENDMAMLSQDLQKANQRLQTLYESAQAVSSTLDLQQVLNRLTQSTTEVMHVKACTIRLLDEMQQSMCLASSYGLTHTYFQKGCLLVNQNPLLRETLAGRIIAIDDITQDTRLQYLKEAIAEGIRSTLTVPLPGRNGPLGIIRVYCDKVGRFTTSDKQYLSTVASHGSIAIENALAYEALQNLDEAKRKFILMVTHELRSPVGVVRSLLRTLSGGYAGTLTDLQLDMISRALRRSDFLQTLIDDLLDLAAGKTGLRVEQSPEPMDLGALVNQIVARYHVPAEEKHIELHLALDPVPFFVVGIVEQLDRAYNNLISNAIKYTPEGGRVTITLEKTEAYVRFKVADTGIGIAADALPHLFEEFYRAPNAKAQVKQGTGLGLAIAKDIITRYHGTINVESTENKGTTITVLLPLGMGIK